MSKISISGNASGTGTLTIAAPNTNTDRTLTLPDATGTINTSGAVNEVPAGSASAPAIYPTGDSNTGIFFPAADTIAFAEGGAEAMRIDSSGRVGIGTTSPTGKTHIAGTSVDAGLSNVLSLTQGGSGTGTAAELRIGASATVYYSNIVSAYSSPGSYLYFGTSADNTNPPTERARITSGGEFLVGTTNTALTAGAGVKTYSAGSVGVVNTGSNDGYLYYNTTAGAYRFYVNASGTIFATSTTISAISDQRFKENIRDLDDGLNSILSLKPRKFDWKKGKGKDIKDDRGFVAQEFEQVFPDLIDEWKDEPPEGEEPYKSVRADLIPVLVKAVQELKAITDAQATRIEALEAEVAALKG